jgi:hypothetical protein
MARHQLGTVYQKRKKAANAYCKGYTGWQMEQGENLATTADQLVFRQGISRKAGY